MSNKNPKEDKTRYVYDRILGMMDGFNAPKNMARFTRAEYTAEIEKNYKEGLNAVDLMIKDRDAFQDKNVDLEKQIEDLKKCNKLLSEVNLNNAGKISELEKEIKSMGNCGNCGREVGEHCLYHGVGVGICDNWKAKDGK